MRLRDFAVAAIALAGAWITEARAASLQVTPVRIQIDSPAAASKVLVSSIGDRPVTAQFRLFKWKRVNGKDELVQTRDVVASPPVVKIVGGKPYVVRIVRVGKTPVEGEETYRLLVDEIPDPTAGTPMFGPRFTVRQSIPVFITGAGAQPRLDWSAYVKGGRLHVAARNLGQKRVKLAELNVVASGAKAHSIDAGLGYILGDSAERWTTKQPKKGVAPGDAITIMAQSDNGPIQAQVKVAAGP